VGRKEKKEEKRQKKEAGSLGALTLRTQGTGEQGRDDERPVIPMDQHPTPWIRMELNHALGAGQPLASWATRCAGVAAHASQGLIV